MKLGLSLGLNTSKIISGASYSTETQAVIDYGDGQGYTALSTQEIEAVEAAILYAKDQAIWDSIELLYFFLLGSEYGKVNIKNPGFKTCSELGSPIWAAGQGFNPNGGALNTGWKANPDATIFALNNAHSAAYTSAITNDNTSQYLYGSNNRPHSHRIVESGGGQTYRLNQTAAAAQATLGLIGTYQIDRSASNQVFLYENGVQIDTDFDSSTSLDTINLYIGAYNNATVATESYKNNITAFSLGESLSTKTVELHTMFDTMYSTLNP